VVQRVPVIFTSDSGLREREIIKGYRTEMVTSVALPSLGRRHGLATGKMLAILQARSMLVDLPKEIVGSRAVEQIKTLFFAIINLHRPISHRFKTGEDAQQGKKKKLTRGAPGITKLAMNVPTALFCVPLTNPSHRKTSKLDMPYRCLGSISPVNALMRSF